MNLEGLTEKRNRSGTVYYENAEGKIIAKTCKGNCGGIKALEDYHLGSGLGGTYPICKQCRTGAYRSDEERKIHAERLRRWRKENVGRAQNYRRLWRQRNPEKKAIQNQRRRALKALLPNDWTEEQQTETVRQFSGKCALTGDETYHWDHAIPLVTGCGGTVHGNMIPLRGDLNISKNDSNIFEWFETNRQRFNLEQWRFDKLIDWLASANAMSVEDYRAYVYECHAKPNVINADEAI